MNFSRECCVVDVQVYNPYLEHAMARRSARMTDFKVYNVDGAVASDTALSGGGGGSAADVVVARAGSTRSGTRGHNDRFYDELDYERKVRKRKARLMVATEEAFNHVTRLHSDKGQCPLSGKDVWQFTSSLSATITRVPYRITHC